MAARRKLSRTLQAMQFMQDANSFTNIPQGVCLEAFHLLAGLTRSLRLILPAGATVFVNGRRPTPAQALAVFFAWKGCRHRSMRIVAWQ